MELTIEGLLLLFCIGGALEITEFFLLYFSTILIREKFFGNAVDCSFHSIGVLHFQLDKNEALTLGRRGKRTRAGP